MKKIKTSDTTFKNGVVQVPVAAALVIRALTIGSNDNVRSLIGKIKQTMVLDGNCSVHDTATVEAGLNYLNQYPVWERVAAGVGTLFGFHPTNAVLLEDDSMTGLPEMEVLNGILGNDHPAKVDGSDLRVGCKKIPLSVLEDLIRAIRHAQNQSAGDEE